MIELRLFGGMRIRLDFTFFAVLLLFVLLDRSGYALMGIAACLLHELGHVLAMAACGCRPERMDFYGAGIRITSHDEYRLSTQRQVIVLAAGSVTNLLCATLLLTLGEGVRIQVFAVMHVLVGIFNLFPVPAFDGGRLLLMLLMRVFSPDHAESVVRTVGILFSLLLFAAALWMWLSGHIHLTAALTAGYFFLMTLLSRP